MSRLGHREIYDTLNALSRHQVLSPVQSRALEGAMAKIRAEEGVGRTSWRRWKPKEIDAVMAVMRIDAGPGRPREGAEIVPQLARVLDRTPEAVTQCMKRLRAIARGKARPREYQLDLELRSGS